jgi:predicted small lipoprotein YifL
MSLPLSPAGRALVLAGVLLVALSACGRRGALEPPPRAALPAGTGQVQAEAAESEVPETILPGVTPTPSASARQQKRGFTIPKDPFILDPLL